MALSKTSTPNETNPGMIIFENENREIEVKVDYNQETIWLSQVQISFLYGKDRTVVTKHINNLFKDTEVDKKSNVQKMHFPNSDKPVSLYSLDVVLGVGYRTNSAKAIRFRQWANSVLKDYLVKGYSLNQKLLENKKQQILEIQQTLDFLVKSSKNLESSDLFLDILARFSQSLILLNKYDENRLQIPKGGKGVMVEISEFRDLITKTKQELITKKEATELFGQEYEGKFESSVATIYQSFGGQELYPSIEEKASNLLYLIIKNHGFVDGNKRIGSILFVYFLAKNNLLYRKNGEIKIDQNTLVALALLVAQSKPEEKEILIKLIVNLIP